MSKYEINRILDRLRDRNTIKPIQNHERKSDKDTKSQMSESSWDSHSESKLIVIHLDLESQSFTRNSFQKKLNELKDKSQGKRQLSRFIFLKKKVALEESDKEQLGHKVKRPATNSDKGTLNVDIIPESTKENTIEELSREVESDISNATSKKIMK